MSRKSSERGLTSSPDASRRIPAFAKGCSSNIVGQTKKTTIGVWTLQKSKMLPLMIFLEGLTVKAARALDFASMNRQCTPRDVLLSTSSSCSLERSKSYAEALDSHRAEAVKDCIEFLKSSSSLHRSKSVNCS